MNREDVANWANEIDWGNYVDNDEIYHALSNMRGVVDRIENGDENEDYALRIKLVACGDGAVGKTSLLISYAQGTFPEGYVPTVFENYAKTIEHEGENIYFHLWDTAGQEEYDRLRPLSYPGADVVLLCFSLVTDTTFESIQEKWYPEVDHYISEVPIILVGTKLDLREAELPDPSTGEFAPVTKKEGNELAKEIGALAYIELSAKEGTNVDKLFKKAIQIAKEHKQVEDPETGSIVVTTRTGKAGGGKKPGCMLL
eukprot:TRINITY_DN600_c0_g1_i1.p1 TRINITY_DN600_c0_g1~~TRINITY_DN600_c0_g1_i1.p1  ORF type:complete len:256 (+),score=85.39 TRINITY_DN600_c0_g1_i1:29-796(+)